MYELGGILNILRVRMLSTPGSEAEVTFLGDGEWARILLGASFVLIPRFSQCN